MGKAWKRKKASESTESAYRASMQEVNARIGENEVEGGTVGRGPQRVRKKTETETETETEKDKEESRAGMEGVNVVEGV
jgi:hypothetical protein